MAVTFPPRPQDEKKNGVFLPIFKKIFLNQFTKVSVCQSVCLAMCSFCLFSDIVLVCA